MDAEAEGKMPVVAATDVETVGIGEDGRVAVRRRQYLEHPVAGFHHPAAEFVIRGDHPHLRQRRAVPAQHFLHRAGRQRLVAVGFAQALHLVGMPQQRQQPVAQQMRGGFMAGEQQQHAGGNQLVAAHEIAALLRCHQCRGDILARPPATVFHQIAEIGRHLADRRIGTTVFVRRQPGRQHEAAKVVRPAFQ